MTTIYPSTLTTSLYGSTRTQSYGFLSYAKSGDIILYSSVALYSDDWHNLFTEIKNKAQNGVYVIILIPQNWCNKNGKYPYGCTNKGAFQLTNDGTKYLKSILALDTCIPIYTTDYFLIHLKACDWISLDKNNPKCAIYYGSSNFYDSQHDEIGLWVYGDYTNNPIAFQSLLSRALMIDDYQGLSTTTQMTTKQTKNYTYIKNTLNNIGYAGKFNTQFNNNLYTVGSNSTFKLDYNETVVCYDSPTTMLSNTTPIGGNAKQVKMSGGFCIALSPPTELWYDIFDTEINLITKVFTDAKEYVKISVMELYIDDYNQSNDTITAKLKSLIINAVKNGLIVEIVTNVGLNWNKNPPQQYKLNYKNLINSLTGPGTLEIRTLEDITSLHTKMYLSDQNVLISSQHPSDSFLYYVYGSSIMFNDPTLRTYYDNFFNSLWYTSSFTKNQPGYNKYPASLSSSPYLCKGKYSVINNPTCCIAPPPPPPHPPPHPTPTPPTPTPHTSSHHNKLNYALIIAPLVILIFIIIFIKISSRTYSN
jgi:hypothetical protein